MAKGKRLMKGPCRYKGTDKPGKRLAARPRKFHPGAALAALGVVALALAGTAELSAAYLMVRDSVDNAFTIGTVAPSVVETFDPAAGTKENVAVKNNGNAPVYVRALVLVTWQDAAGATLSAQPAAGTDYELTGAEAGWTLGGDGYYYCTQPIQPGASTPVLVKKLTDKKTDAGRYLCVDVIAQAVQVSPAEAVGDVFPGATVGADGVLIPPALEGGEGA